MIRHFKFGVVTIATLLLAGVGAHAADPTEIKTEQGKSVGFANFVAARPDCSSSPGPQPLPVLVKKPANGRIGMQIATTDVASSINCATERKVPSIALFYVPKPDFVGDDDIQLEVDAGDDKVATLAYRFVVQAPASVTPKK
jgi:hypothetical protein